MKILVCGGRGFDDYQRLASVLDQFVGVTHLIHGAARGADTLAARWAERHGIQPVACPALWDTFGRSAGFRRNDAMLALHPDLVVAFPGGRGTEGMVRIARDAGVAVYRVEPLTD